MFLCIHIYVCLYVCKKMMHGRDYICLLTRALKAPHREINSYICIRGKGIQFNISKAYSSALILNSKIVSTIKIEWKCINRIKMSFSFPILSHGFDPSHLHQKPKLWGIIRMIEYLFNIQISLYKRIIKFF